MRRVFRIVVLGCAVLLLTGCSASEKSDALWEQVKIGDIAPSGQGKRSIGQPLMTIDFVVHLFEMPAENISALDNVWWTLYTKPLRFNDSDAFSSNLFSVGFGQVQMWNKVRNSLQAAGGKKIKTISLLLLDGQADDLVVATLGNELTIFYASTDGSMEGATIGPGELSLRMKAQKIPGSRGVCSVDVQPVFSPPIISSIPQLAARTKSGEFLFASAGFSLKMSPGDFVFLGPKKYSSDQMTLAGLFFSRSAPSPSIRMFLIPPSKDTEKPMPYFGPVVRTYMIVCTRISD